MVFVLCRDWDFYLEIMINQVSDTIGLVFTGSFWLLCLEDTVGESHKKREELGGLKIQERDGGVLSQGEGSEEPLDSR